MPFDPPVGGATGSTYPGTSVSPSGLLGQIIGGGINLGFDYLRSRFQEPGGGVPAPIPGDEGDLPQYTLPVQVFGTAPGCGCGSKPRVPDFVTQPGDPCYPRATQRTTMVNGCKVTIPVWAPARKRPRMNPLNIRAARRATRRISGMARALKGARTAVNKAARQLK